MRKIVLPRRNFLLKLFSIILYAGFFFAETSSLAGRSQKVTKNRSGVLLDSFFTFLPRVWKTTRRARKVILPENYCPSLWRKRSKNQNTEALHCLLSSLPSCPACGLCHTKFIRSFPELYSTSLAGTVSKKCSRPLLPPFLLRLQY